MPIPLCKTEQVFERLWRPGHRFRPRACRSRRYAMLALLLLFSMIIAGYIYLTDSRRVRDLSETYLSELLGAKVHVGQATLSVFEGLKLRNVSIDVENSPNPEARLFQAENIELQYDVKRMLAGQIVAQRIIATSPRVSLIEDLETGRWNYQRLIDKRKPSGPSGPTGPAHPAPHEPTTLLPEIVLRNAQVDYRERREGHLTRVGTVSIEGRWWPAMLNNQYSFEMQSRGQLEGIGPTVRGTFDPNSGKLAAQLRNFRFGRDLTTMLPAQVRDWWQKHQFNGRLNIPEMVYSPNEVTGKPDFRVEMELDGVSFAMSPHEWMSREEIDALSRIGDEFRSIRIRGMDDPQIKMIDAMSVLNPILLEKTAGTFVFTQDGIEIRDLTGRLEDNGFRINGRINGYTPEATARINIRTLETENLHLPHSPRFVNSLPAQVREVYEFLKPEGTLALNLTIARNEEGKRPEVSGEIVSIDASFTYKDFKYPVRGAVGKVVIKTDPAIGGERAEIQNLRGYGIRGGPNERTMMEVHGWLGPLDERLGCDITITCKDARAEPALMGAFNEGVRKALAMFDPAGKGGYPDLRGDFTCRIEGKVGIEHKATVTSFVDIADSKGMFKAFPYPLERMRGRLEIGADSAKVALKMPRGNGEMAIDGTVGWEGGIEGMGKPDLRVTTKNFPMDDALLESLSAEQREWIRKMGLAGLIDLNGHIFVQEKEPAELGLDVKGHLHDSSVWPVNGKPVIQQMSGDFHLTTEKLDLTDFRATRGTAELKADGKITWPEGRAKVIFNAEAKNLTLDESVYGLLPPDAKEQWDGLKPKGSVDAELRYDGPSYATGNEPPKKDLYLIKVRPRELSVKPTAFAYSLDKLGGAVEVTPGEIRLNRLTARHGETELAISGTTSIGSPDTATSPWELSVQAKNLTMDRELMAALPSGMKSMLESSELKGKFLLEIPKLIYWPATENGNASFDAEAKISTRDGSMNLGVPVTEMEGSLAAAMVVRKGLLHAAVGKVDFASLRISDRPMKGLKAEIIKPAEQSMMQVSKIRGSLAGGELAGQIDISFPDHAPIQYGMDMVLRGADVQELARMEGKTKIDGELTASLAIEGQWGIRKARRGRGDVLIRGKEFYQIPVLLGLLEVTNLAVPLNSPFTEGSARYSIEGQKVAVESLQLKSMNMTMAGSGYLDFGTKKVLMNFSTDNPNWPKLPFVSELLDNARQELLQIRVRGSIQEPKVSAAPLHTFSTTVDEVLKGEGKK